MGRASQSVHRRREITAKMQIRNDGTAEVACRVGRWIRRDSPGNQRITRSFGRIIYPFHTVRSKTRGLPIEFQRTEDSRSVDFLVPIDDTEHTFASKKMARGGGTG